MPKQSKNLRRSLYQKDVTHPVLPAFKKDNKNGAFTLFSRLNPFNWFNEFSKISISMEEFANKKNKNL
jgi:hypothetical protein